MKQISIIFSFAILFLLVGCAKQQTPSDLELHVTVLPTILSTNSTDSMVDDAYPGLATTDFAYPGTNAVSTPVSGERIILDTGFFPNEPVPTPVADRTTVTGDIIFTENGSPLVNVPVILAKIYRNDEGDGAFVYDTATSPYALTDENGRFIFSNVDPAEYIMVVGNMEVNRYELLTELDGGTRIINAPSGEILDLGAIEVELEW